MLASFFDRHGDIGVLKYGERPEPVPGPNDVIVKLKAAGLNRLDIWVRNGWPGIRIPYPFIPGADGAGKILKLGTDVSSYSIGNRVVINPNIGCGKCYFCEIGYENRCKKWNLLGESRDGTYAQLVKVPAKNVMYLPEDIDEFTAAASALVYQTAWHSLITVGRIQAGETVLIVGAAGGVNTASIQISKYAGAIVYVVGSNHEKLSVAESCGADFLIDRSKKDDWAGVVHELTDREGVNVVVDNVGLTFMSSLKAAKKGGRLLTVGNTAGPKFKIDNRYIFGKHLSILGSTMSTRTDFQQVMALVFSGAFTPVIDKIYPLADAGEAQMRLETGKQKGKIILAIP